MMNTEDDCDNENHDHAQNVCAPKTCRVSEVIESAYYVVCICVPQLCCYEMTFYLWTLLHPYVDSVRQYANFYG